MLVKLKNWSTALQFTLGNTHLLYTLLFSWGGVSVMVCQGTHQASEQP